MVICDNTHRWENERTFFEKCLEPESQQSQDKQASASPNDVGPLEARPIEDIGNHRYDCTALRLFLGMVIYYSIYVP